MPMLSQAVTFSGEIYGNEDLSAIASFTLDGTLYLAVGSDESKKRVQLLKGTSKQQYTVEKDLEIHLPVPDSGDEIDIESITFDTENTCLYVVGSHSRKRKTVRVEGKRAHTAAENRIRLKEIKKETDRNRIFRIDLDPKTGQVKGEIRHFDRLKDLFVQDDYLKTFVKIPSKENGIDIE